MKRTDSLLPTQMLPGDFKRFSCGHIQVHQSHTDINYKVKAETAAPSASLQWQSFPHIAALLQLVTGQVCEKSDSSVCKISQVP